MLLLLSFLSKAQEKDDPKQKTDSLFWIYVNHKTESNKWDRIVFHPDWKAILESKKDFERLSNKMLDHYSRTGDLNDFYFYTKMKIVWLSHNQQIGKAIVAADRFRQEAERKGDAQSLINAGDVLCRVYDQNGMFKEWAENAKKLYYLRIKHFPENKMDYLGAYTWALNQCGFFLRDTVMLDSCLYFQKQLIKHSESKKIESETDIGIMLEHYSTHLLTLKRMKQYTTALNVVRRAYSFNEKYLKGKNDKWYIESKCSFMITLSQAHFELGTVDSAFYYLEEAEKIRADAFNVNEGRVYYYTKLKQYDKATAILKKNLFSPDRYKDISTLHYMYGWAAPVFAEAGMYKEATFCYARHKAFRDSTLKIKQKAEQEYQSTNTALLIEAEQEAARIIQEKKEAETETAKKQKNIIFVSAILIILIVSVFLFLVYKRYRFSQEQNRIIEKQKAEVETQKHLLAEKQKEIIDSIRYAQRIQMAHLPKEQFISRVLRKLKEKKE